MAWVNEELGRRFAEIAHLLALTGADRFRVRAYERSASALATAPVDLAEVPREQLKDVKGVGDSTAKKVIEYLDTGEIAMLTELRAKVPAGVTELDPRARDRPEAGHAAGRGRDRLARGAARGHRRATGCPASARRRR